MAYLRPSVPRNTKRQRRTRYADLAYRIALILFFLAGLFLAAWNYGRWMTHPRGLSYSEYSDPRTPYGFTAWRDSSATPDICRAVVRIDQRGVWDITGTQGACTRAELARIACGDSECVGLGEVKELLAEVQAMKARYGVVEAGR
jgi:hypothetical protein